MDVIFGEKNQIVLEANNKNLNKRWTLINLGQNYNNIDQQYSWVYEQLKKDFKRTNLLLGYDNFKKKEVIIKNVQYDKDRLVKEQRAILKFQGKLLSDLKSELLPKVLDFFYIKEDCGIDYMKKDEPVLILEYNHGEILENKINNKEFIINEGHNKSNEVDIVKIVKIIKQVINFNKDIENKGYVHLGISPEHIAVSEEDKVSFLGLGRICNIKDGVLDSGGVNFSRSLFGYSAPELNDPKLHWGKDATARELSVFSLGVLLHQLICGSISFSQEAIKNGSLYYPNNKSLEKIISQRNGHRISNLIERLCNHNPKERLLDYDEIDGILDGIMVKPEYREFAINPFFVPLEKELIYSNLAGYINSYNVEKGHGFVKCNNGENFYLRKEELDKSSLVDIKEGMEVIFDVEKDNSGEIFVCNIRGENCVVIDVKQDDEEEYEDYYEYNDESTRVKVFENILIRIRDIFKKSNNE